MKNHGAEYNFNEVIDWYSSFSRNSVDFKLEPCGNIFEKLSEDAISILKRSLECASPLAIRDFLRDVGFGRPTVDAVGRHSQVQLNIFNFPSRALSIPDSDSDERAINIDFIEPQELPFLTLVGSAC